MRATEARFLQLCGLGTWGYGLWIRSDNVCCREAVRAGAAPFDSLCDMLLVLLREDCRRGCPEMPRFEALASERPGKNASQPQAITVATKCKSLISDIYLKLRLKVGLTLI